MIRAGCFGVGDAEERLVAGGVVRERGAGLGEEDVAGEVAETDGAADLAGGLEQRFAELDVAEAAADVFDLLPFAVGVTFGDALHAFGCHGGRELGVDFGE